MQFQLRLKGTTYFNQAAGTGGNTYTASDMADETYSEKVLYLHVSRDGIFGWLGVASRKVEEAYMRPGDVENLDTLGIVLFDPMRHRQQIQALGAGAYALYRFGD